MKKLPKILAALLVFAAAAAFVLIKNRENQAVYTKDLFAMDTYFSMKAYGEGAEDALALSAEKIRQLEGMFSVTAKDSDLHRINHATVQETVYDADKGNPLNADNGKIYIPVNEDTFILLEETLSLCEKTRGALDITIYSVLQKWGFTTGNFTIPKPEEIKETLRFVNHSEVVLDNVKYEVGIMPRMQLDLGAVAKGYTGDCVMQILREKGVDNAILDFGGNVVALGTKPDGSKWKVGIRDPFDTGRELGVLETADRAVITSGSYERFFVGDDGKKYWHILNPADGYPADNGLVSVTVIGESGVCCDGLSTALFVMGRDKAVAYWRENGGFEMILVTQDRRLYVTEGIEKAFKSSGNWQSEMIRRDGE